MALDDELLFRILCIAIYATFAGVRVYYRSQARGRDEKKDYTEKDAAMMFLSIAIICYFISIILYLGLPDWIAWASIPIPMLFRWLGVGIAILCVPLTSMVHRTLGRQYSAKHAIQEDHYLVITGLYSRVRHPMYTILNMFSLSISIMTANLLPILFAILVAIPFPWIARKEEQMMIDQFGDEYREYMNRTGRFFPRIR